MSRSPENRLPLSQPMSDHCIRSVHKFGQSHHLLQAIIVQRHFAKYLDGLYTFSYAERLSVLYLMFAYK